MSERPAWAPGPAWLFAPADRPDRCLKAHDRADVAVVDLEDAVAADRKDAGRAGLLGLPALAAASVDGADRAPLDPDRLLVRVNPAGTAHHDADREAVDALAAALGVPRLRVMLAKAEDPAAVAALAPHEVVVLAESPAGVDRVRDLLDVPGVVAAMWGAEDLVAGLGGLSSRRPGGTYRDVARHARSTVLVAAKARGLLAVDAVHLDIGDLEGLREECEDAAASGFDATCAIHPGQVGVIRAAYRPSPERLAWAGRVLAGVAEHGTGVFALDGQMVDGPVVRQAEQVLRRAVH